MTVNVTELRAALVTARREVLDSASLSTAVSSEYKWGQLSGLDAALRMLDAMEDTKAQEFGQGVDLGAVARMEEFSRQAGGAVDEASGTVYSDADSGL